MVRRLFVRALPVSAGSPDEVWSDIVNVRALVPRDKSLMVRSAILRSVEGQHMRSLSQFDQSPLAVIFYELRE